MDILSKTVQKIQNVSTCNEKHHISICEIKLNELKNNPINPTRNISDVLTTLFIDNVKYTLFQTAAANITAICKPRHWNLGIRIGIGIDMTNDIIFSSIRPMDPKLSR